ncbi:hypothetical protein [Caulobacter sp. DWP3-1-3b2]|uniref:hypothetical protein n=1 Tax=Caulobacter sp. DWP3-1-3b2 TaxID=2804643 RepID=UPI003CEB2A73
MIGSDAAGLRDIDPMNWLFELSAACALLAFAFPLVWKLVAPTPVLRPALARTKARRAAAPVDQDTGA